MLAAIAKEKSGENVSDAKLHPNVKLIKNLNFKKRKSISKNFAKDIVWRFFNPMIPNIAGDYKGIDGVLKLFEILDVISRGSFEYSPAKIIPVGNELVMMHVKNRMNTLTNQVELDTIVVWRIVNKKVVEVWNIPSVYNDSNDFYQ